MHSWYHSRTESSTTQPLVTAQATPLGGHLMFLLTQVEYEFRSRMQRVLAEVDLDMRQYATLAFIAGGYRPTQHELAKILHLDPSQIVTLTKGLAARGLLVRETLPEDRRARVLVITDQGKRAHRQAASLVQRVEDHLSASLSRRDRAALKTLLERILPLS